MKKMIAGLIAAALLGLPSCGTMDNIGDQVQPDRTDASSADGEKNEADEKKKPEINDKTVVSTPVTDADKTEMTGIVRSVYDAAVSGDGEEMLKYVFPSELVDCMKKAGAVDSYIQMMMQNGSRAMDLSGLKITSVADADYETENAVKNYYNAMVKSYSTMAEKGYDMGKIQSGEYSQAELDDISSIMGSFFGNVDFSELEVEEFVHISAVKKVTFNVAEIGDMYMYKVDGDGWRSDSVVGPMMGYMKMTFGQMAGSAAKGVSDAANAAATALDSNKTDLSGACIISSESGMDVFGEGCNVPADEVRRLMEKYMDRLGDEKYFIVFSDGVCIYCAVKHNGVLGTYPPEKRLISLTGDRTEPAGEMSYHRLYEECCGLIE